MLLLLFFLSLSREEEQRHLKAIEDLEEHELEERLEYALRLQELYDPDSQFRQSVRSVVDDMIEAAYDTVKEKVGPLSPEQITVLLEREEIEESKMLVSTSKKLALEIIEAAVEQHMAPEPEEFESEADLSQTAHALVTRASCAAKEFLSSTHGFVVHPIGTTSEEIARELVQNSVSWVKENLHYYVTCTSPEKSARDLVQSSVAWAQNYVTSKSLSREEVSGAAQELVERVLLTVQKSLEQAQEVESSHPEAEISGGTWDEAEEEEINKVARELAQNALLVAQKSDTQLEATECDLNVSAVQVPKALPMRLSLFYDQENDEEIAVSPVSEPSLSPVCKLSVVGDYEKELQESANELVEDVILSARNSLERLEQNMEIALAAR